MSTKLRNVFSAALFICAATAPVAPACALETRLALAAEDELVRIVEAAANVEGIGGHIDEQFAKDFVILFIPGILGSVLEDSAGAQIWGSGQPSVARLALNDPPELAARTMVQAEYPLGLFKPDIYGDFDKTYLSIDGSQRALEFSYDWRHDIDRIADRFEERIQGDWADDLRGKRLIVIAHSMGGLVAWSWKNRYYQADNANYDFEWYRLLLLGSPLGGSCDMLRMLLDGYQPGGDTRMEALFKLFFNDLRAAAFTFPSVFQLLPRFDEHSDLGVCLKRQSVNRDPQDHFSIKVWQGLLGDFVQGDPWWNPFGRAAVWEMLQRREGEFWDLVAGHLATARRFRDSLDLAEGENMEGRVRYFYSNAHDTTKTLIFAAEDSSELVRHKGDGDGRVLSSSATLDRYAEGQSHSLGLTHGDLPHDETFLRQLGDLVKTLKRRVAIQVASSNPKIGEDLAARQVLVPLSVEDWSDGPDAATVAHILALNRATLQAIVAERPELAWDGSAQDMVRLVSTLEAEGTLEPGAARPLLELAWLEGSRADPDASVVLAQRLAQKLEEASVFAPAARVARAGLAAMDQAPLLRQTSYERDLHYRLGSSLEALGAEANAGQSYSQAFRVAKVQAAAGADEAMVWLGQHYARGQGVERDPQIAYDWYRKAAQTGDNPWAKANLGLVQLASWTEEANPAKARTAAELFDQALASSIFQSTASATHVGNVHWGLARARMAIGEDPQPHFIVADQKLRLAWQSGDPTAALLLGEMYQTGLGQERDVAQAADWYRRAGFKGQVGAMQRLAGLYDTEQLPGGKAEALNWYLKAAGRGDASAMLQSGFRFETGLGTAKNLDAATYWYQRAKLAGAPEAATYLERLQPISELAILEE